MIQDDTILVTGGAGMIGRVWPGGFKPSQAELDVRAAVQVAAYLKEKPPSAIVHLAAIDIYQAEADPLLAFETNVLGTYHLARAALSARVPLVFVSSGAVFNGRPDAIHDEQSTPQPCNVFGYTKYTSEILLQEMKGDFLIIRTGWVFGGSQANHKKFVDIALTKAVRGETIEAVNDRWGSPTYVIDLVNEIRRLLKTGQRGIVHVVNEGKASACDIAAAIITTVHSQSNVQQKRQADFMPKGPRRGISEALTSRRVTLRPWTEALHEYITHVKAP